MLPLAALEDPLIPVPPVDRVRKLDSLVAPLLEAVEASISQGWQLERIRHALLSKLVSGDIRVAESYDPSDILGVIVEETTGVTL
jgi:hypothetical protein